MVSAADFTIENIVIEVANVIESYGDAGWDTAWHAGKQNCSYISEQLELGTSVVLNCTAPIFGNYIRISKLGDIEGTLSFCEVVVSGKQKQI